MKNYKVIRFDLLILVGVITVILDRFGTRPRPTFWKHAEKGNIYLLIVALCG